MAALLLMLLLLLCLMWLLLCHEVGPLLLSWITCSTLQVTWCCLVQNYSCE